jgi:hypothetical protein
VDAATVGDLEVLEALAASVANARGPVALSDVTVEAIMAVGSADDVSSSSTPRLVLLLTTLLLVGGPLMAGAPMETLGVFSNGVGVGSSPSVAVIVCCTTWVMV